MKNSTRKWIRGGLEAIIHGGCAAVTSSFTAAMVSPAVFPLFSPNSLKMAAGGFATNGVLRFVQWWGNNPLPPESDSLPTPVVSLNPLAKVQLLNKTDV